VAGRGTGVPENNVVGHAALLHGMRLHAEVVRSTIASSAKAAQSGSTQRKPAQSAGVNFELRATW